MSSLTGNAVNDMTTLVLPYPRLAEGRFSSVHAFTDETLFEQCQIRVAFTCRDGGVSAAPFDSLNLGDHVNDDMDDVYENRRRVLSSFACDTSGAVNLINPKQVHEKTVVTVMDTAHMHKAQAQAQMGADAVVTGASRIPVLLCFADCVPLIIVAPTGHVAVIHAGWRGVVNQVTAAAFKELCQQSGARPEDCNIYIGPYIHACHFEVGQEAIDAFSSTFGSAVFVDDRHVDMGYALRITLAQCGADTNRICDVDMCTVDNQDLFFSYRGAQGVCGRHGAFAVSFRD